MSDQDNMFHWNIRIKEYLDSDWSHDPSPFVQVVAGYLPKTATVLEIGGGAGMDSIWLAEHGHTVTMTDVCDDGFEEIGRRIKPDSASNLSLMILDAQQPLPFKDAQFDCVYAQLSLHYFTDADTHKIFDEIHRVIKSDGIVAVMMNTVEDKEYDPAQLDDDGYMKVGLLKKRYFSCESLQTFTNRFKTLLLDNQGRTAKDDEKNNIGMIRYVGRKI